MSVRIKNIVIISMLVLTAIPFLLLTDIFPFLRFGMFAEPVNKKIQFEQFEVSYVNQSNSELKLDPKTINIEPHFFFYLARNYFYRNESILFLKKISKINKDSTIKEWRLKKLNSLDKTSKADTIIIWKSL